MKLYQGYFDMTEADINYGWMVLAENNGFKFHPRRVCQAFSRLLRSMGDC